MQEALAAGDVDAMRLLLLAQAQPVAVSPAAHPPRQHDMLTARADSLANSLLSRGLTTLERAEAASASRAATSSMSSVPVVSAAVPVVSVLA